jgi:hypothetical protein
MTLIRSVLRFARVTLTACVSFWLSAAVGCGNNGGGGDGGTSGSASGSPSSGASGSGTSGATTAGNAGSGGSPMGGSPSEGGESGSGGIAGASGGASGNGSGGSGSGNGGSSNVEPGERCTANCPTGTIRTCFDSCPLGACDEGGFFADEPCSTYYPSAISDETIFCAKNQTATYCLTALDQLLEYYVVSCAAGTPTVTQCVGGCGVDDSTHAAKCNE